MASMTVSAVGRSKTYRVVGSVNTPDEASDKAAMDAETAPIDAFVRELMLRDGSRGVDGSPERGKVSTTLPLTLPRPPKHGDQFQVTYGTWWQSFNRPSTWWTGKTEAGQVGVVLDFDPATKAPVHLQVRDPEGKLSMDAKYVGGVLNSYDNVIATVGGGRVTESYRRTADQVVLTITRE